MSTLEWAFSLLDGMSCPAGKMVTSLDAVNGALGNVEKASAQTESGIANVGKSGGLLAAVKSKIEGLVTCLEKAHESAVAAGGPGDSPAVKMVQGIQKIAPGIADGLMKGLTPAKAALRSFSISMMGNPPALPGDRKSLTFP